MTFQSNKARAKTTRGGAVVSTSGSTSRLGKRSDKAPVVVEGLVIPTKSNKALLVQFEQEGEKWLPISQIAKQTLIETKQSGLELRRFVIPTWLAESNDLTYMDYDPAEDEGEVCQGAPYLTDADDFDDEPSDQAPLNFDADVPPRTE